MSKHLNIAVWMVAAIAVLSGCGGNHGGLPNNPTNNFAVKVAWPERSRDITPPASALSARITVEGAGEHGTAVVWIANRGNNPAAHVQTSTSPQTGTTGTHHIKVDFYTADDAGGTLVGTAEFDENIPATGQISSSVTVASKVDTVSVPAGQKVTFGVPKLLTVVAHDAQENIIALEPGSAFWNVTAGNTILSFQDGLANGQLGGMATVTATVDGKVSGPVQVEVVPLADFLQLGTIRSGNVGRPALNALSGDGTTIVGSAFVNSGGDFGDKPFRWTRAGGYQELNLGLSNTASAIALGVNADGTQIVGYEPGDITFAWVWRNGVKTRIFPLVISNYTVAVDISDNGGVIVGAVKEFGVVRALRWRNVNNWQTLWTGEEYSSSQARAVSADGNTVVGFVTRSSPEDYRVMVQHGDSAPIELPLPSGVKAMIPMSCSADGEVVVGYAMMTNGKNQPFRWSSGSGTTIFDYEGLATACSGDGSIVIGNNGETTFVWTQANGIQPLPTYAANNFGLAVPGQPKMGHLISNAGNVMAGGVAPYEEFYEKPWVITPKP